MSKQKWDDPLEAVTLFLDLSLRADRLEDARRLIESLQPGDPEHESRTDFVTRARISLAVATAAAGDSASGVRSAIAHLDAADTRNWSDGSGNVEPRAPEWAFAARLLARMGGPAVDELSKGIAAREPAAIALAGLAGFTELRAALESARGAGNETDARIDDALVRLDRRERMASLSARQSVLAPP